MTRKLQRSIVALASSIPLALASSCDIFGGLLKPADIDAAAPYVRFIEEGQDVDLSLYASSPGRSAYVVLSTGSTGAASKPSATSRDLGTLERTAASEARDRGEAATEAIRSRGLDAVQAQARFLGTDADTAALPYRLNSTGIPSQDYLGKTQAFHYVSESDNSIGDPVNATCRYASGSAGVGDAMEPVDFGGGRSRTLSIWVAEDCWHLSVPPGEKKHLVDQTAVEALALKFFGEAGKPSDSIYAWVTNILGDEWGDHTVNGLISESGNVTILLADISQDNSDTGGIVGYFYPGDSIVGYEKSNERVMFVIDAVMYANPDDEGRGKLLENLQPNPAYSDNGWLDSDYWPQTIFSTLAHEFQHMIHFYQKAVKRGGSTRYQPVWIDELCSMQIEDLLADKLGVSGPRGVAPKEYSAGSAGNASGRLSDFVQFNDDSLDDWEGNGSLVDSLKSYAAAYAFGAYLTRNYGGAEFIRRVVQTADVSPGAVAAAASTFTGKTETIEGLLRRWGAAVLLSNDSSAPALYRYNSGGAFTSTMNGIDYSLGSINVWNYVTGGTNPKGLLVFDAANVGQATGGAISNILLGLGDPTKNPDWTLTVPEGMYATVVID